MKIIFATENPGKMREVREILSAPGIEILSMKEAGLHPEIREDGETFLENARIKVRAIGRTEGAIVLADDSGIEIDAFGRGPGVYSSRYLGEHTDYLYKNRFILDRMSGLHGAERSARYRCVIAALFPDGTEDHADAVMEGEIAEEAKGTGGFGYDPIFFVPEYGKTGGELTPDEKNLLSHRGKALRAMTEIIRVKYPDLYEGEEIQGETV